MIIAITNRASGDVDVWLAESITDISKDSRTLVEVKLMHSGETDRIDLHMNKIDILPNVS